MVSQPAIDRLLRLGDGRALAWAEWGDPAGRPVLLFHGIPSSRLSRPAGEEALAGAGVRLITVDRPGIGASDPLPGRTVSGWAEDVAELAGALELERFGLLGFSAGGPYAASCAARLPERVSRVAIVAGAPGAGRWAEEPDGSWHVLARRAPWIMQAVYGSLVQAAQRSPERFRLRLGQGRSDADRATLGRPEVSADAIAALLEGARPGTGGWVEDMRVRMQPWGFSLQDVEVPCSLWQGEEDSFVSRAAFEWYQRELSGADARLLPGEGHFLMYDHATELLSEVVA